MPKVTTLKLFPLALTMSVTGLALAIVVHTPLFFRYGLVTHLSPLPPVVRRISFTNDGRKALVLLAQPSQLAHEQLQYFVGMYDTSAPNASLKMLRFDFIPRLTTAAKQGRLAFISAANGELYSLDLQADDAEPQLLGQHKEGYATLLECTNNGSLVVVGNLDSISGWDSSTATCLWRRNDLRATGCAFLADTERLFCSHFDGQLFELDARTGITRGSWNSNWYMTHLFDVSSDDQRIAALDCLYRCVVSELGNGTPLWSVKLRAPLAVPHFSPDGKYLLAACPERTPRVLIYAAASGELVGELRGTKGEVVGLAVSPDGIAYAWDDTGEITAWNLGTRSIVHQFVPPNAP